MATLPADFWCEQCRAWTPVDKKRVSGAFCSRCAEPYQCGECGFEINRKGECLRGEAGAGTCPAPDEETGQ